MNGGRILHITDIEIGERNAARKILSFIELVCFSKEYEEFRINKGTNGQRDLIIKTIKETFLV